MSEASFNPSGVELANRTREALRKIRRAVTEGLIGANQMQEYSSELTTRFAKALLATQRPELLKEEDRTEMRSHVDSLNEYVGFLLDELRVEGLNKAGQQFDSQRVNYMLDITTHRVFLRLVGLLNDKGVVDTSEQKVVLISTGALQFALVAYLHNIAVSYAAVSADYEKAFVESFANEKAIVLDDDLGNQVRTVKMLLEKLGVKTRTRDFKGTGDDRTS
jgi:hypothetical protein